MLWQSTLNYMLSTLHMRQWNKKKIYLTFKCIGGCGFCSLKNVRRCVLYNTVTYMPSVSLSIDIYCGTMPRMSCFSFHLLTRILKLDIACAYWVIVIAYAVFSMQFRRTDCTNIECDLYKHSTNIPTFYFFHGGRDLDIGATSRPRNTILKWGRGFCQESDASFTGNAIL